MRYLLFSFALSGLLGANAGCGKNAEPDSSSGGSPPPLTGFQQKEYDQMLVLNQAAAELESAFSLALGEPTSAAASEKSRAMGKVLVDSGCKSPVWQRPSLDFRVSFEAAQRIEGEGCPVGLERTWEFNRTTRTFSIDNRLQVVKPEFAATSAISAVRARGRFTAAPDRKNTTLMVVDGQLHYELIRVEGIGDFSVRVNLRHIFGGDGNNGFVAARIDHLGAWSHIARINWSTKPAPRKVYSIDNKVVSEGEFVKLFSVLQLDELLDKTKNMR